MKKLLISSAIAAAIVIPATTFAGTSLYGDIRFSVAQKDVQATAEDDTNFVNNASRIGVKGSYDMGNGLTALFHVQLGIDNVDNNNTADAALTNRFAFGGIKGGFGTALYGTLSSPYKMAGLKVDPFYDVNKVSSNMGSGNAGATHGLSSLTNGFFSNVVAYVTPSFSGFNANIVLVGDDSNSDDHHMNYGIAYDGMGANVSLQYIDFGGSKADATRIAVSYKMSALKLGLSYEMLDDGAGVTANDQTDLYISAAYSLSPKLKLAASWGDQSIDNEVNATEGNAYNIGVFYKLYEKTEIRATYSDGDSDSGANDVSVFAVGISQKFSM